MHELAPKRGYQLVTVVGLLSLLGLWALAPAPRDDVVPVGPIALGATPVGSKPVPYVASASPAVSFGPIDLTDIQVLHVETREPLGSKPWLSIPRFSAAPLRVQGGLRSELDLGHGVVHRFYEFPVQFTARPDPGEFTTSLEFAAADEAGTPILSIPVHGIVPRPFDAIPASLYATVMRSELPWTFRVRLRSNGALSRPVQFTPLPTTVPGITIEPASDADATQFLVRVHPEQRDLKHVLQFAVEGSGEVVEVPMSVQVD